MQRVISRDGTRIAVDKRGAGPALLIVGGSLADHRFYAPLAEALAPRFTVYTLDRRGRGHSEDTKPYAPEREVEDAAAVMALAGAPAFLYGHSAGCALALRAAAERPAPARLVLADPPYTPRGPNDEAAEAEHAEQAAHIQRLNDIGDFKGSTRFFLSGFGLPDDELDAMLASPAGAAMIEGARTLPYDYAMLGDGLVPAALAAKVRPSTLVLASGAAHEAALQLVDAMPNARFAAMDAPVHALLPDAIVPLLESFLAE